MMLNGFGRTLILAGSILIVAGVFFTFAGKIPWLGRLPGDVYVKRGNFQIYFPIATSVLLSLIISLILLFIGRRQ